MNFVLRTRIVLLIKIPFHYSTWIEQWMEHSISSQFTYTEQTNTNISHRHPVRPKKSVAVYVPLFENWGASQMKIVLHFREILTILLAYYLLLCCFWRFTALDSWEKKRNLPPLSKRDAYTHDLKCQDHIFVLYKHFCGIIYFFLPCLTVTGQHIFWYCSTMYVNIVNYFELFYSHGLNLILSQILPLPCNPLQLE